MTYEIIDNIEVPASAVSRNRARGPFGAAVDKLEVGQGFVFDDARELRKIYPALSPSKFPSDEGMTKKFKVWQPSEGKVGLKRLEDIPARADADAADEGNDE